MRNSWTAYLRRLAAVSVMAGSTAMTSAMCYAVQLAYDDASDDAYDLAWTEGTNGGFGFGPWNFDGTFSSGVPEVPDDGNQQMIDDGARAGTQSSMVHNNIGRAWTMFNPKGADPPGSDPANPPTGTDIARVGRSFAPLEVGETLNVVFDNPTERRFFRGYNIKLNTVGENLCYGTNPDNSRGCTTGTIYPQGDTGLKYKLERFEYFNYGEWYDSEGLLGVFDTATSSGARLEFTLTGATTYAMKLWTTAATPSLLAMRSGDLDEPGNTDPLNWIEFQFFNTDSDTYPNLVSGARETDFYIRSLEIVGPDEAGVPGDYNDDGQVDAGDYVRWRNHLGEADESNIHGNGDGGGVTISDYTWWKDRYGNPPGSGGFAHNGSTVPEPGTLVLWFAAFSGLVGWRERKGPEHGEVFPDRT